MGNREYVLMRRGARVIEDGKHIKTVPLLLLLEALSVDFVEDISGKRLTRLERFRLMEAAHKRDLKTSSPYLFRLIKNKQVKKAVIEVNPDGDYRYIFVYDNLRVIVPEKLFWECPIPATYAKALW